MSFSILITYFLDSVQKLWGEVTCLSLLGDTALRRCEKHEASDFNACTRSDPVGVRFHWTLENQEKLQAKKNCRGKRKQRRVGYPWVALVLQ